MKNLLIIALIYFFLKSRNDSTVTQPGTTTDNSNVKKFTARFNVLETYVGTFTERLKTDGFEVVNIVESTRQFQGLKLFIFTFSVNAVTQLEKYNQLKLIPEIEVLFSVVTNE